MSNMVFLLMLKMRLIKRNLWGIYLAFSTRFFLVLHLLHLVNAAVPQAISVPIDNSKWIGNDGSWSPINLQIGTPVQAVDLFPSTAGQETLVIGLLGCDGTIECRNLRGGLFAANESSTFEGVGEYDLGLDQQLGFDGAGYYGLDSISLSDVAPLSGQIVAIVNSTENWTGFLGLGVENTTIATTQASSFIASLVAGNDSQIPSQSYGYTAGASYRLKQVPSSLTLGGYDANRLVPNNATFTLNSNQQPVLAVNSISLSGLENGNIPLLDITEQDLFTIDSTTPYLWFPESVTSKFEEVLGLVYNKTLDIYLYQNISQYQKLTESDFSFEFDFAELPGAVNILSLSIPSKAFTTLNLTFGYPGLIEDDTASPIPYFPLRKAASSTQYTIGRAFLQETYLTVDYGRNNFSLSQAKFSLDASVNMAITDILPISTIDTNSTASQPGNSNSRGLPTGTVVGIAVGVAALIATATGTLTLLHLRRPRAQQANGEKIPELAAREYNPHTTYFEPNDKGIISEISSTEIEELPTPYNELPPIELPGSVVFQSRGIKSMSKLHFVGNQAVQRPELAIRRPSDQPAPSNLPTPNQQAKSGGLSPGYSAGIHSNSPGLSPASVDGGSSLGPIEISPLSSVSYREVRKMGSHSTMDSEHGPERDEDQDVGVTGDRRMATYALEENAAFELTPALPKHSHLQQGQTREQSDKRPKGEDEALESKSQRPPFSWESERNFSS